MNLHFTSRLYLYHKALSKYDFTDKYVNFIQFHLNLRNTKINCSICESSQSSLNEVFYKELLMYRKLYIKQPLYKSKLKLSQFIISNQKKYFFLLIEVLLNSIFLFTKITFQTNKNNYFYLLKFPTIINNNFFCTYANLKPKINPLFLNFTFNSQLLNNTQLIQSCLFLPKL